MTSSVAALFVSAAVAITLTPVLTGYRGTFRSKLSGFGFTAEVNINGQQTLSQVNPLPHSGRSEAKRVDGRE